jgi:hypothetical protein
MTFPDWSKSWKNSCARNLKKTAVRKCLQRLKIN